MPAAQSILETIGGTPVVRLARMASAEGAAVHLKLELLSPGASAKDRVALALIRSAEAEHRLQKGGEVVAATSGSFGISLALVCAARGYPLTVVMSEAMTLERRATLRLYGARVVLTPAEEGLKGARRRANELAVSAPALRLDVVGNSDAVDAHAQATGRELVESAREDGGLDAFVCGVGSGALFGGVGRALRGAFPSARLVAVEPAVSPVVSGGTWRLHRIQGLDAEPESTELTRSLGARVMPVADTDAWATAQRLAREEGLLAGISTGANVWAALEVARELGPGRRVYTVAVDSGERYFSLAEQFRA